ncbi:MAG: hypothetical protein K2X81_14550, partial [Candidatus Obscuribacterales bacterium]|nr:hypothetical protein [Candidatus Obscuribacterales bacterium]
MADIFGIITSMFLYGFLPIAGLVIIFIVGNWVESTFFTRRYTAEEMEKGARVYQEKLMNSKPEDVETYLGGKLPASILELYADTELLSQGDFSVTQPGDQSTHGGWYVCFFTPCNVADQKDNFLPKRGQ